MLIDEPHSFLHPTAERLLLEFLRRNQQHKYVITTHSAIFINAVPASQITHLTGNGYGIAERKTVFSHAASLRFRISKFRLIILRSRDLHRR